MKTTLALIAALVSLLLAATSQAATLRLSPAKVKTGTMVTAQGTGFANSSSGRITLAGAVVRSFSTDSSGKFTTTFRVPRLALGTKAVRAAAGSSHVASAVIVQRRAASSAMMAATAGQRMMLAPAAARSGAQLTVTGWKFARSAPLAVTLDGSRRAGQRTTAAGTFVRRFLVPGADAGAHTVAARAGSRAIAGAFQVVSCGAVTVCRPYTLDFSMDHGGLNDKDGTGTGFRQVISGNHDNSKLDVTKGNGKLAITTTAGLTFTPSNPTTQDNALGVGVNASRPLVARTVLASPVPPGTGNNEQAGLFLGKNGDNYVKVVLQSVGSGLQVQVLSESGGSSVGSDSTNVNVGAGRSIALTLRSDSVNRTFTAQWAVSGGGSRGSMELGSIPASLFSAGSLAGIFTSHRFGTQQTYSFDSFLLRGGRAAGPPPPGTVGTWTNKQALPVALLDAGGAALGGKLYMVGGKTSSTTHQRTLRIYTASSNSWATGADLPAAYAGGAGVENVAAVAAGGKLYVFGGQTAAFAGFVNSAAVYDPDTDSWTALPDMPTARGGATAQVIASRIYVVGGMAPSAGGAQSLRLVEVYDPGANSWTTAKPLKVAPRDNASSAVLDVGGSPKLFVFGGRTLQASLNTLRSVEMYDPVTNTWTQKAQMPTGRRASVAGVIDNRAIVVGGERSAGGSGAFAAVEEYNPATNRWRALRSLPTGRHGAVGGVISSNLYVAGGATASPPSPNSTLSALNQAFHY